LSFANLKAAWLLWLTLFMVVAYSIKNLRFKEIPFLDSLTSAVHFVGPMLVGFAMAEVDLLQVNLVVGTIVFLIWGMASHAFGAVQDVRADREAKIKSIATQIGARLTVRLATLGYLIVGLLSLTFPGRYIQFAIAALPYLFVVGRFWNITDDRCEEANKGWKVFIWLNFLAGAVVCATLVGPS